MRNILLLYRYVCVFLYKYLNVESRAFFSRELKERTLNFLPCSIFIYFFSLPFLCVLFFIILFFFLIKRVRAKENSRDSAKIAVEWSPFVVQGPRKDKVLHIFFLSLSLSFFLLALFVIQKKIEKEKSCGYNIMYSK